MIPSARRSGPAYRLPTLANRLGWGLLYAIPLGLFYLGWPLIVRTLTMMLGVPFPFSFGSVLLLGLALLALWLVRFVAKPTRAYGPASVVYALALVGYLWWIASRATVQIAYQGSSISITFSELVLVAIVVPVLMLLAGLVVCLEDGLHPGERYPFDFPA